MTDNADTLRAMNIMAREPAADTLRAMNIMAREPAVEFMVGDMAFFRAWIGQTYPMKPSEDAVVENTFAGVRVTESSVIPRNQIMVLQHGLPVAVYTVSDDDE